MIEVFFVWVALLLPFHSISEAETVKKWEEICRQHDPLAKYKYRYHFLPGGKYLEFHCFKDLTPSKPPARPPKEISA